MKSKRLPSILCRPIDSNGDVDQQDLARFKAVFAHFGVAWERKDAERVVLALLIAKRFKTAFEIKPRPVDKRCKVQDVAALKSVVDAVMAGTEDQLADQSLKALGAAVRRWLADRGKKATRGNICTAISQKDKDRWKGEKPATLRDNLYRPPGKRKGRAERDWLVAQLTRARDGLNAMADTAPNVEPYEE